MILIITNSHDVHPNPVIELLNASGVPFFRLNTENWFSEYTTHIEFLNGNWRGHIIHHPTQRKVELRDIKAIWERRPMAPCNTFAPIDEQYSEIIKKEQYAFYNALRYAFPEIPWIGHPLVDARASSKILQKKVALDVGMKISDAIFSNDLDSTKQFAESFESLAIKPIKVDSIQVGENDQMVFYTRKLPAESLSSLNKEGFLSCPSYFEGYVEKQYEIRTTVVGDEFYSAWINSQDMSAQQGKEDWREGYDHGIKFSTYQIPAQLEEKCLAFMKELDLNFGCFDFIKNLAGEYVFLECNPNGQWLWIEEDTGQLISKSVFEWLMKKANA